MYYLYLCICTSAKCMSVELKVHLFIWSLNFRFSMSLSLLPNSLYRQTTDCTEGGGLTREHCIYVGIQYWHYHTIYVSIQYWHYHTIYVGILTFMFTGVWSYSSKYGDLYHRRKDWESDSYWCRLVLNILYKTSKLRNDSDISRNNRSGTNMWQGKTGEWNPSWYTVFHDQT